MKIYPKNKLYMSFPPLDEGQAGWIVNGKAFTAEQIDTMNAEARGYERTMSRLAVSKARRIVECSLNTKRANVR